MTGIDTSAAPFLGGVTANLRTLRLINAFNNMDCFNADEKFLLCLNLRLIMRSESTVSLGNLTVLINNL